MHTRSLTSHREVRIGTDTKFLVVWLAHAHCALQRSDPTDLEHEGHETTLGKRPTTPLGSVAQSPITQFGLVICYRN